MGQEDLSKDPNKTGGVDRTIHKITLHPNYTSTGEIKSRISNDIAILEFIEPVDIGNVMPVCLPKPLEFEDIIQPRSNIPR